MHMGRAAWGHLVSAVHLCDRQYLQQGRRVILVPVMLLAEINRSGTVGTDGVGVVLRVDFQ